MEKELRIGCKVGMSVVVDIRLLIIQYNVQYMAREKEQNSP